MTTADTTPRVRPAALMDDIARDLAGYGITIEPEDVTDQAWLAAAALLLALGIEPLIADDDHSANADMVRGLMFEHATRTTTRSRRSV